MGVINDVMERAKKTKSEALEEKRKLRELADSDLEFKMSELNLKLKELDEKT